MADLAVIEMPHTDNLATEGKRMVSVAQTMQVTDPPSYEQAGTVVANAKRLLKNIDQALAPTVSAAYQAHKAATALRTKLKEGPERVVKLLSDRMLAWQQEERRREREEQERLARIAREEEEKRAKAAELLRETGHEGAAEALEEEPPPPVPIVPTAIPATPGVTVRKRWCFTIADVSKLPPQYIQPDRQKIQRVVTAMGKQAEEMVPGIKVYEDEAIVGTGK